MYTERDSCIFCLNNTLEVLFKKDYSIPMRNYVVENQGEISHSMPYNIQICSKCKTVQTKYIGDLSIIYQNNFAGAYGSIRSTLNTLFAEFIHTNLNVHSITEIGAGNGELSDILLEKKKYNYTIIDPSYGGSKANKLILNNYFENIKTTDIKSDTLVMSHVFEHFYNPQEIIKKIRSIPSLKYIHLALPDLDSFIEDGTYHVLNPEHTFYVTNDFIIDIFKYYGFHLTKKYLHERHSVFFEFEKLADLPNLPFPINKYSEERVKNFFSKLFENVKLANSLGQNKPIYIWPCSMHTIFALSLGLEKEKLTFVLDNSPHKIGKYLYHYEIPCKSFKEIISNTEEKHIILTGGCYNKEIIKEIEKYPQNSFSFI